MNLIRKIVILVAVQIILIVTSFLLIAYFESQTNFSGNMVNIAGKNRLLTSMVQIELYHVAYNDIVEHDRIFNDIKLLEENIFFLKRGGTMLNIEIPPLPSRFHDDWSTLASEFELYKATVLTALESQATLSLDDLEATEMAANRLILLSDILTQRLGYDVEAISAQLVLLDVSLGILNVIIHIFMIAFILRIFRKHTEEQIRTEKFSIIGEFASMMAHDLRNPLGTIRNSIEMIQRYETEQPVRNEIQRINRSIKRMSHQIEGVLNYVRSIPISTEPKKILDIVEQSVDVVPIPENIKLHLPEDGNDLVVQCDAEKLEFVFTNMLLNAVQAIGSSVEGNITIRILNGLKDDDDLVILEFENSGSFIPKKDISRIFDPLFTTKMEGTGLGLTSCRNIIEQHGGTIDASSTENLVKFTICLPRSHKEVTENE